MIPSLLVYKPYEYKVKYYQKSFSNTDLNTFWYTSLYSQLKILVFSMARSHSSINFRIAFIWEVQFRNTGFLMFVVHHLFNSRIIQNWDDDDEELVVEVDGDDDD